MQITGRAAATLLARQGLSHSATQHLLATGIAGRPTRAGGVLLYDRAMVEQIAAAVPLRALDVIDDCPHGYLVARFPRDRTLDVARSWESQRAPLAGPWFLGARLRTLVWIRAFHGTRMPLIATVGGIAVAGGDVAGFEPDDAVHRATTFVLEPPGPWIEVVRGRPCAPGRGRPVQLRGWHPGLAAQRATTRAAPLQE